MRPDRSLSFWRQVVALQAEAFAGVPDHALVERFTTGSDAAAFEEITRRESHSTVDCCNRTIRSRCLHRRCRRL